MFECCVVVENGREVDVDLVELSRVELVADVRVRARYRPGPVENAAPAR